MAKATIPAEEIDYFVVPPRDADQLPFITWLEQMGIIPQFNGVALVIIASDKPQQLQPGDVVVKDSKGDISFVTAAAWPSYAAPHQ